jgi:hypothetical protein
MQAVTSRTSSPAGRRSRHLALLSLTGLFAGCTAADNLSYPEITAELDAIVRIEGQGAERRIRYEERAAVSPWYMRSPMTWPLRWPLGVTFGRKHLADLENPAGHVRELVVELPDEAGDDLSLATGAMLRLLLLAELDPGAGTRLAALDGLCATADALRLPVFSGDFAQFGLLADTTRVGAARIALQTSRPAQRGPDGLPGAQATNYAEALATLVERPLPDWSAQQELVVDLFEAWRSESVSALRSASEQALRQALGHALEQALVRAVQGRDPQAAELRVCAMQQIRRLGGPHAVPLLLAVMAASASEVRGGRERFDPDPAVQLQLIHLCGQLRGELALQALRLPGRDDWEPVAPADFLAMTVLRERDYFSKLRGPALAALALCLQQPKFSQDPAWVEVWYRDRQRQS